MSTPFTLRRKRLEPTYEKSLLIWMRVSENAVMSVRVLFQNRADAFKHWGGDTTQMVKTKKYPERLGSHVDVNLTANPDVGTYDIIDVFNIQSSPYSSY